MKYMRFLTLFIVLLIVGCGGGSIKSGNSVTGAFTETVQLKSYTFDVLQGDSIHFRVDSTNQTFLSIYDEDDILLGNSYNGYYFNSVLTGGTYRVDIVPRYAGMVDNFTLHYANGTTANEHGELISGGIVSGALTSNDLDTFTLFAVAGDSIHLSLESSQQTFLYVYKPDGSLLGTSYNGFYANNLPQGGMYRVIVQSRYAFTVDDYDFHYVNGTTADEHGELTSGDMVSGELTSNDLDTFTLSAVTGDSIHLSLDSSQQTFLYVYNPDGSLLGTSYNGFYANNVAQGGVYRIVVKGRYAFTVDDYEFHYANGSTANELGVIESGSTVEGSFTSNDLDSYQFSASAGGSFVLTTTGDTQTYMSVYQPNGVLLGNGYNGFTGLSLVAGGTYRVVIQSRYAFIVGDYAVSLN